MCSTKRLVGCIVSVLLLLTILPLTAYAEVPQRLSYQGYLTDPAGNPVADGRYTMIFSIYDVAVGGADLWSESQAVTVTKGVYDVQIGVSTGTNPFPANLFEGNRYLGVTVGTDDEMMPRQLLTTTAFSMHTADADTLDGMDSTSFSLTGHSHFFADITGSASDAQIPDTITINYAATADSANTANSATIANYATTAGSASTAGFATSAGYATTAGDADTVDGEHASAFADSSHSHDSRYFTEGESDSRFVNVSGDSMSGSGYSVLEVSNTGSGNGIWVSNAGQFGIRIDGTGQDGVLIDNPGSDGVRILNPDNDGIHIYNAADDGVDVSYSNDGVYINNSTDDGIQIDNSGQYGVEINGAWDGIHILNATQDGLEIDNADYGVWADTTYIGVYGRGGTMGGQFWDTDSGIYSYVAYGGYGISSNGTKNFIQDHPTKSDQVIVYASLEGGEAGTYYRGTAQLTEGTATIELPEHFRLVTEDDGLTVQVTPRADCNGLFVADVSTTRIVVKELQGGSSNARFDFCVNGVRAGYADYKVMNTKSEIGLDKIEEIQREKEREKAERRAERERERESESEDRRGKVHTKG